MGYIICVMLLQQAIFAPAGGVFGTLSNTFEKPHLTTKVVLLSSVLTSSSVIILTKKVGILGTVSAPFVVEVIGFFTMQFYLKKHWNINWITLLKEGISQWKGAFETFMKNRKTTVST